MRLGKIFYFLLCLLFSYLNSEKLFTFNIILSIIFFVCHNTGFYSCSSFKLKFRTKNYIQIFILIWLLRLKKFIKFGKNRKYKRKNDLFYKN